MTSISCEEAQAVVAAVQAHSQEQGKTVSVAVVDAGGALRAAIRMDGAAPITLDVAWAKANQSVLTGFEGGEIAEMAVTRTHNLAAVDKLLPMPLIPARGGRLIRRDGRVIGAVGISGAKEMLDGEFADFAVTVAEAG